MEIWGVFGPTNAYRASFVRCRSGRKEGGTTLRFSLCSRLTLVGALGVQPQPWGPVQAGGPPPPSLAPGRLMATRIFGMCAAFHSLVEPHEDFRRVTAFPSLFYRSEHRSDRLSTSPGSPSLPEAEPSLEAGISSLTASPSMAMSRRQGPGCQSARVCLFTSHLSVSFYIRRMRHVPLPLPTQSFPARLGPIHTLELPRPPSGKHCSLWKCLCPSLPLLGPALCSLR